MREQDSASAPIMCTLTGNSLRERLGAIVALMRDALHSFERHGLVLELSFAGTAAERVREMVRKERDCCGFLTFDLREVEQEVRLTITAPEGARDAADFLFEQFVGSVEAMPNLIAVREGASADEKAAQ